MARLAIYDGSALVRELDVPDGTLRVGRHDQNDIVLIDPGKAVSRFHAELRIEHGTCVIADLNSQNGTWVAGRRVQQATLVSGQVVVVGTHRLVFKADESAQPPAHAPALAPQAPAHAPEPAPQPPAIAPAVPVEAAAAMRPSAAVHRPVVPRALPPAALVAKPVGRLRRALLLVAGSMCVAAAGVAGGVFWWPASSRTPAEPPRPAVEMASPQPVLGGPPTEMPLAPAPVLAGDAPTPASPGGAPMSAARAAGPPAVASGGTASAAPAPRLTAAPVGTSPAPGKAQRGAPAPAVRNEAVRASKKAAEPRTREINPAQLVERARAAIGRGDYAAGLGFLEPVMRVDAGNPDALDLLAAVRAQGHDAFKRGRQFDELGRAPEAIVMYDRAARLLPPDHPSARIAKERLAALR